MRRAALATILALTGACAFARKPDSLGEARRADEEALAANAALFDTPEHARHWVVVQQGNVVASASLPDDAVRAAQKAGSSAPHRFVFRPADRGTPLYRLAYLADGGIVAGRRFLSDLGLEATGAAGRPPVIRRKVGGASVDLAKAGRLVLDVSSLDDAEHRSVEAAYDPDFDGGLILTRDVAASLHLERFEIPGGAEVQVALGRPFRALRATATVRIPALGAAGPAEVVYETAPLKK